MLDSVQSILDEYSELERRLADPAVHGDQDLVRSLNKRYAALAPTVAAARSWQAAVDDLGAARELATEDEAFAAEVPSLLAAGDYDGAKRAAAWYLETFGRDHYFPHDG